MNITAQSIRNPAAVAVGVAVLLLFGVYALAKLPVQLFPDIERPQISVGSGWRAASPREIESEILEPLEEVLQGIPGVIEMESFANQGWGNVELEFSLDTNMQQTLIDVISRLNRLPAMPADSDPPRVQMSGFGDSNQALSWFFIQQLPSNPRPIQSYEREVEELMKERLERIPGVAGVDLNIWNQEELQVIFDPYLAAEFGIEIPRIARAVGRTTDVSGGFVDVGRRQFTLRFAGRYSPEQLGNLILDWRNGRPVKLGDIAEIRVQRGERRNFNIQNGNPAISMRVDRASGANVLEALGLVKEELWKIRDNELKEMGLTVAQSFDASVFIKRAIGLVSGNLVIGMLLAIGVLWLFLRRFRATVLVAAAIPISLLTTFVILLLTGRTLNVISLAGLAFAVGMVLDAAIIVLENIVRLREEGRPADDGALEGTSQVWGALVASTATTVAIFLPVIFLKDVEGQIFGDLALTIAIAVLVSMFAAITVLPTAASKWLAADKGPSGAQALWKRMSERILKLTDGRARRYGLIAVMMGIPIVTTYLLFPNLDYLPPVKRDAVDVFFNFPPGTSNDAVRTEIADKVVERFRPYMDGEKEPALKNYYFIKWPNGGTIGARAKDQSKVKELERIVREEIVSGFPDTQAFVMQGNLFGNFEGNRTIGIHLQSRDSRALLAAARRGMELLPEVIEGTQPRPHPGTEMAEPELRLTPFDERIIEAGWSRGDVSSVMRALGDGLWLGEHFDGDKRVDMLLRSEAWTDPDQLMTVPLATPNGGVVPLGELVSIERTVGPSQLRRLDGRRTVSLSFAPPESMSLEEAMDIVKEKVEPELKAILPPEGTIVYGGSANSLDEAVKNMSSNFLLAFGVLFLLLSALFRSLRDALLVLLVIPLATVGGVLMIRLMNLFMFQPMDLLTMIGFVILLGLVVNNAILLVHQTRSAEREGLARRDAVRQALELRLRPIFMSTLTSIFGMLPLLLMPGEGSIIYRGLAAVIVGGMSVSAIFTILLLPSLLRLGEAKPLRAGNLVPETI